VPYKQSQWSVHLAVDGIDLGYWAAKEGGNVTTEDPTYADWDGDVRLGGKRSREDVTVRKLYRESVHQVYRWLDGRAGSGRAVLTSSPVRDDGVSWGTPIVVTGVVGEVTPPEVDKESSDGGELEVVVQADTELA
jgi:hypothetical protein